MRKLLGRINWKLEDFALIELNEAFAAQVLACDRELKFDRSKLNVHGGAISLGHPIGCSGARVLVTLLHALRQHGGERGLATLCVSGGMGVAISTDGVGSKALVAEMLGKYDTIGIRPVGKVPQTEATPIVATALAAGKALGQSNVETGASSTDSNIPMSLGIQAITIGGGGSGGGAHAITEWYQDGPEGYKGPQWALLLVAALAGMPKSITP